MRWTLVNLITLSSLFSRILVTTDIWARGIDVQTVGLVINYDLPLTAACYLHRIGRSGRFGRRGLAIRFSSGPPDKAHLATIAKTYSIAIDPAPSNLTELTETPKRVEATEKNPKKQPKKEKEPVEPKEEEKQQQELGGAMSAAKKRKLKLKKNKEKRKKVAAKKNKVKANA